MLMILEHQMSVRKKAVIGAFSYLIFQQSSLPPKNVACTSDAKLCPDGSAVGRTGPNCEFAPCPEIVVPVSNSLDLGIGQTGEVEGVSIMPLEVAEDSRCPLDVVCIQAGTVRLKVEVAIGAEKYLENFLLGHQTDIKSVQITLTEVTPAPNSKVTITPDQYKFLFTIYK